MRSVFPLLSAGLALTLVGCTPSTSPSGPANSGGTSSTGTATAGGTIKLGVMPKQIGIPYFNACKQGAEEAAKELGDVELTYDGPTEDKSEEQSRILDTWRIKKFDAVAVACNDPEQISTSLARCRDEGISAITWDADANPESSKRQFFVNQAGAEDLAKAMVDEMAKQAGETAKVGVVSSSPTAPNQSAWLKKMEEYRAQKYPKMTILEPEYAGENQIKSEEKAQSILKVHPDVKGIYGMTSVALPGAANAVKKAGQAGKIAVVGLGTPKDMKPFVDEGVVKTVILWNPVDLGYLTVHVARAVAKGELKPGSTELNAGRMGKKTVKGNEVLLGDPMLFTKENIGNFDF
ncbi:MAG: periplasmic-binding component of superfamily [Armatimonadetes bacterium]|jgi:ABC-type sugar transport system substrate-binding protein|nr:periplasmic-binding component of superfamily [Armatimonadota bacterium]